MKKNVLAKLRGNAGETIGETLVALLISALALVMLAGAISAAANVITRSNNTMTSYYKNDNALAESSGGTAAKITISGSAGISQTEDVNYNLNNTFANTPVAAYQKNAPTT